MTTTCCGSAPRPSTCSTRPWGASSGLAEEYLLERLEIVAVRLLGCETATADAGRRTLRMLARTLRLPVLGTRRPLLKSHYNAAGLDPAFTHLLT